MLGAANYKARGEKSKKKAEALEKKAENADAGHEVAIYGEAAAQYEAAAYDVEEAASEFLSEGKPEKAEDAFGEAAHLWEAASRCWVLAIEKRFAAFSLVQAAHDYAARAAVNERGGEHCEAYPQRQNAAEGYKSAAKLYLEDATVCLEAVRSDQKKLQQAVANGNSTEASELRLEIRVNQSDASDDMDDAASAATAAANEFALAKDDFKKCK